MAVRGTNADGHSFIPQVVAAGASAVVCEDVPSTRESSVTYIKVPNSHVALGYIASAWYDSPSAALRLVGVTGTNGKTTTATLIYEMARLMGHKAGLLSTVVNLVDEEKVEAHQTTPDAITINALLRRAGQFQKRDAILESNGIRIDPSRRLVWKGETELALTLVEYKLLCLFLENPDRVLSRELILDRLWDGNGNYVDDNTLSVYIRRLRRKIEDDPGSPTMLLTEIGGGYQWKRANNFVGE